MTTYQIVLAHIAPGVQTAKALRAVAPTDRHALRTAVGNATEEEALEMMFALDCLDITYEVWEREDRG